MKPKLVAGDTLDFSTHVEGFPATTGGWTLKYRLVPRSAAGTPILITAVASGDDYRVQLGPTDTQSWGSGDYTWTSWVEKSGARYTVEVDQAVTIIPNPSSVAAGYDGRTTAKQMLDAVEATLLKKATRDQLEYTIQGRSLKRMTPADLLAWRDVLRADVANEDAANAVAEGLDNPRVVGVRFARP